MDEWVELAGIHSIEKPEPVFIQTSNFFWGGRVWGCTQYSPGILPTQNSELRYYGVPENESGALLHAKLYSGPWGYLLSSIMCLFYF